MTVIVDYGMGNVGAIANMLRSLGHPAEVTRDPSVVERAERLILPGVGAFDHAVDSLERLRLREPLDRKVRQQGTPVLGICLGLQLLARSSEEGTLPGFGWIDARVVRFRSEGGIRVPHMGWNTVDLARASRLFAGLEEDARFYFVHSYHLTDADADAIAFTSHGRRFVSAIEHGNVMGVQFHPEKSHRFGKRLLGNFVARG